MKKRTVTFCGKVHWIDYTNIAFPIDKFSGRNKAGKVAAYNLSGSIINSPPLPKCYQKVLWWSWEGKGGRHFLLRTLLLCSGIPLNSGSSARIWIWVKGKRPGCRWEWN
jgi:hypothetical protein